MAERTSVGKTPLGTGGGQGPMKKKTAEAVPETLFDSVTPLPYKNSREAAVAKHGKNS